MSVKIIVDSTVDLTPDMKRRMTAVPLTIRFGDEEFADGVSMTHQEFYARLPQSKVLPTTSQPTPAAFEQAFREAVEAGHEVVCVTIASKLSGTYQSATIASEEFPGKVFVVDSRSAAIGAGILAMYAQELADQGMGGQEILSTLIEARKKVRLYFIVDTLEYLHKGGRLNSAVAVVGGLLNIKPVLCVDEAGEIKMLTSARGQKKAFSTLTDLTVKAGVDREKPFMLAYTGTSDENLRQYMEQNTDLWAPDTRTTIVGSAIGVHAGPGAIAVSFFEK